MSKKKVAIVGAFDRFNYGDLLFPIIIEQALGRLNRETYTYEHYALKQSDLSRFGARTSKALYKLKASLKPNDVVVLAGGEILGSRWAEMLVHSSDRITGLTIRGMRKLFGTDLSEYVARTMTRNTAFRFPWVFQPEDFDNSLTLIYNAVGGYSALKNLTQPEKEYIYERLRKATYVSVREQNLRHLLVTEGGMSNVALSPDSAILMSEFFDVSELLERASNHTKLILNRNQKGYICLQIGNRHARGEIDTLVDQLETLFKERDLKTVLLPIGRAPGHEDQVALKKIAERMTTPVEMPEDDIGIYDIMLLIASAKCFVGTSLHGAVTALSYAVPHVGLTLKVVKLADFLKSWDIPEQQDCIPSSLLAKSVETVLRVPQSERDSKRDVLVKLSWQDFESISQHITKGS